jgi:hypothetical protein
MAQNYATLIAAWNSSIQPPAGVTGTGIGSSLTTAQKLGFVNAWTVTGTIPSNLNVTGAQIANCINWAEFNALTAQRQSNLLALCANPGPLLGGSTNTALLTDGMIIAYFASSGPTLAALTAMAQASVQPWWGVSTGNGGAGLASPINNNDLTAAGLS